MDQSRRVGRPPKAAAAGSRVSLGLKVTAETKDRLEAMARASGRTQSQEAERLIVNALEGSATAHEILGGLSVASHILAMAEGARTIERFGVPLNTDAGQRLFVGLVESILRSLPSVAPTPEEHDYAVAKHRDRPDAAEIAKAKAAVDAYEARLEAKAKAIREAMKLPLVKPS